MMPTMLTINFANRIILTNRVILSMSRTVRERRECGSAVRVRIITAKDLTGTRCRWQYTALASITG